MDSHNILPPTERGSSKAIIITLTGLVIVAGLGYAFVNLKNTTSFTNPPITQTTTGTTGVTPTPSPTKSTGTPTPLPTSAYKDGTYSATGSYNSPGGREQITVTITLNNDIITDSQVVSGAGDPESRQYQNRFISGYKVVVIGKDITTLSLGRVSGSSLTPKGFNDAVAQIEAQAKV